MFNKMLRRGLMVSVIYMATGCAQNKEADNKGTYIHARHMATGSNIPVPNRASGAADTATTDLEREQFQGLQNNAGGRGMGGGGGG